MASFSQRADWIISQASELSAISPARAGELVRQERLSLEAALASTGDKKLKSSLAQIISVLDQAERRVSRVETVTPELYLSLGLVRPDTSGRRLSASQNSLGILSDDGTVLLVSMSGRSGEVVAGGDLIKNAIDLSVSAAKTFVLNPDNIIEIDSKNKTSAVALTDEDDAWADPVKLSAFGGSLFVLDKSASEIYKFSAVEAGGYGSQRRWFAPGPARSPPPTPRATPARAGPSTSRGSGPTSCGCGNSLPGSPALIVNSSASRLNSSHAVGAPVWPISSKWSLLYTSTSPS